MCVCVFTKGSSIRSLFIFWVFSYYKYQSLILIVFHSILSFVLFFIPQQNLQFWGILMAIYIYIDKYCSLLFCFLKKRSNQKSVSWIESNSKNNLHSILLFQQIFDISYLLLHTLIIFVVVVVVVVVK